MASPRSPRQPPAAPPAARRRPTEAEITQHVRDRFKERGFSAIDRLIEMAENPPDDLKASDLANILKFLAEYEGAKVKSTDMEGSGKKAGVIVIMQDFSQSRRQDMLRRGETIPDSVVQGQERRVTVEVEGDV